MMLFYHFYKERYLFTSIPWEIVLSRKGNCLDAASARNRYDSHPTAALLFTAPKSLLEKVRSCPEITAYL